MRFRVEDRPKNLYAIVPEGREPLPALFDSREQAQRIADKLGQRVTCPEPGRRPASAA